MGGNNPPVFQNAVAQNVSATGACIHGIEPELKVGEGDRRAYEGRKARRRVVWRPTRVPLGKRRSACSWFRTRIAPGLACFIRMAEERTLVRDNNRRKFRRHKISFPLELRDER